MSGTLRTLNGLFVGVLFIFAVCVLMSCRVLSKRISGYQFVMVRVFQETTILI